MTYKTPEHVAEQTAWQRQTVAILADVLAQSAKTGLPVLSWTIGNAGASLVGRSLAQPSTDRRAALSAWADELDIELHEHASNGVIRLTGKAEQRRFGPRFATVVLACDIYDDDGQDPLLFASARPEL